MIPVSSVLALAAVLFAPQGRGIVNAVELSTPSLVVGQTISVKVLGNNPCGAAFIDYGDGTAITYAISALPTAGTCSYTIDFGDGNGEDRVKPLADRVTHVYPAAGEYSIVVLAGSGCRGTARRTLTIR